MMSSGSSDGAPTLNPPTSVQGTSDEGQVTGANSENSNHTTRTDVHVAVTAIEGVLSEVSVRSARRTPPPCNSLSPEPAACHPSPCENIQAPVESGPLGSSSSEAGNRNGAVPPVETLSSAVFYGPHAGSKCMCPKGEDSDSSAGRRVPVNTTAGSLHEEAVEVCLCDGRRPAARDISPSSQSANGAPSSQHDSSQNTELEPTSPLSADVLPANNEDSVTTSRDSQPSPPLGVSAPVQQCHTSPVDSSERHPDGAMEPCDGGPSPPGTHRVTKGTTTTHVHADSLLSSTSWKNLNTQTLHSAPVESEASASRIHRLDTRVSASLTSKEKALECRTNLNSHAISVLKKSSGLKPPGDRDYPVWSSSFKLQVETQIRLNANVPKLKGLAIKSRNTAQEEPTGRESPVSLNQSPKYPSTPTTSSSLKDKTPCLDLPKVSERRPAEAGPSGTSQTEIQFSSKPPAKAHTTTQRTFIEVRLSSLSGSSPQRETVTPEDSQPAQRGTDAGPAPTGSPANSTAERTKGKEDSSPTNGSKPRTVVETSEALKPSMKTMDRRSLPTDTALSSVRHKIKSFENLANFDKPVAKSSDIHSYALAYRASLHQRIAGYMGVVNSIDCRSRQRSFTSYVENLMPTTRCSPLLTTSPSSITLTNLELPRSSCSAVPPAEGLRASDGAGPLTPQVLRRKHGRLPLGSLRQLRAISMPDLDQLCTEDFGSDRGAAVETTERGGDAVLQTATEAQSSPAPADRTNVDVTRDSGGDVGSTEDPPQGTPETPGQPPGWAIRWEVQSFVCSLV